jgi:tetratricopeptide (TPR) repeat protein
MLSRLCFTLVLIVLLLTGSAQAGKDWAGKTVLLKGGKQVKIETTSAAGEGNVIGPLSLPSYKVLKEENGRLKVTDKGREGWFDKAEAILLDDAVDYFTERIKKNAKDAQAHASRAEAWRLKNDADKAIADYSTAVDLVPDEPAWWNYRGVVWLGKKDFERAFQDFDKALDLQPNQAVVLANRGAALLGKRNLKEALRDLNDAIRIDGTYVPAYSYRGDVWIAKKEYDQGIADLNEAIKLQPSGELYIKRGLAWKEKGDLQNAYQDFDQATRLSPKMTAAWIHRGQIHVEWKNYDTAIYDFGEALKIDPKHVQAYIERGNARSFRNVDEALKDYEEALKIDPKSVSAYYNRGVTFFGKGNYDKAVKDFEEGIKLDGKSVSCHTKLAWVYAACPDAKYRDGEKAVKIAKKAVELSESKDPAALDAMGAAYAELGAFTDAVLYQKEAIKLLPAMSPLQNAYEARLRLYEDEKPYRGK